MLQGSVEERIRSLLPAVQTLAATSYSALGERYPQVSAFDLDSWDFFMSVAGLHAAIVTLNAKLGPQESLRYIPLWYAEINAWDRLNGVRALVDCREFVNHALPDEIPDECSDAQALVAYALGMWVLSNLYRCRPPDDQRHLAQAIGGLMFLSYADWWD